MYSKRWNQYRPQKLFAVFYPMLSWTDKALCLTVMEDYISKPFIKLALMRLTKPTVMFVLT